MWQLAEKKPFSLGLLASGAGDEGCQRVFRAAIARAVRGAVVLAAEGDGSAGLPLVREVEAGARVEGARVVSGAEGLAGASATGAALAVVDGGAEAWHGGVSWKWKGSPAATLW